MIFFFSPNENHSSSTWRTFLYRNLLPDNGSFLSAKLPPLKLNHNPLTLPHSETFLQPAKTEAGRGGTGREKLGIFVEGSSFFSLTIKWFGMSESQESYSCVSGCRLPYNFCFRPWVTVLTSQLAAMASLQVITKTGIRLHENLHVRDCCCLPQQNPQQRHRRIVRCSVKCDTLSWGPLRSPLLISQGEDRLTHGILTTHVPALHSSVWKLKLWTTAGEMAALASPCTYQLVPEPGWGHTDDCGNTWGALSSGLRVSPKYTSGDSLTEPRSVNENYGQCTIFVLHIKPRAWLSVLTSGERKNIDNSKENIPEVNLFHSATCRLNSNKLYSWNYFSLATVRIILKPQSAPEHPECAGKSSRYKNRKTNQDHQ